MKKRLLALTLCAVMIVLATACDNKKSPGDSGPQTPVASAMGRYMETTLPTPQGLSQVFSLRQFEDGTVWMAAGGAEPFMLYSSTDLGETWTKHDLPWVGDLPMSGGKAVSVHSAYILSPDEIYLSFMIRGASTEHGTFESEDFLYRASRTELEELDATPMRAKSNRYGVRFMIVSDGGDLLVKSWDDITQLDGLGTKEKNVFGVNYFSLYGSFITRGDQLIVAEPDPAKILTFSLTDGALLHSADAGTPLQTYMGTDYGVCPISALAFDPADENAVFYANRYGLFRTFLDGSASERIMDGELSSLNLHTNQIRYLIADNQGSGNFLAISSNSGPTVLYRYAFNPDVPAVPSREIKVFSLVDNRTARQAITQMQAKDPDIKISLQIGVVAGSGVTSADALRTLSTEMLAGQGPDVLILDGLPIDTYMEGGVLLDLTDDLGDILTSEDYLPQLKTYQSGDGKTYTVTARFSPYHMAIKKDANVTDMQSLVEYLKKQDVVSVGCHPTRMMEKFYFVLSPGWFPDGKTFDADRFRQDLEAFEYIIENQPEFGPEKNIRLIYEGTNAGNGAAGVAYGTFPSAFFLSYNWNRTSQAQYFINEGLIDALEPFPAGGVYRATNTMGINAATKQKDLAVEYIRYVLGPEIQPILLNDGFGVHKPSFIVSAKSPLPEGTETVRWNDRALNQLTGEFVAVDFNWAWVTDEEVDGYLAEWGALTNHEFDNAVIREMIAAETAPFFAGEKSIDDVITALQTKIELYMNE